MTAMADEGALVFDSRMAGYGAEPTTERPTDDACERRLVAEGVSKLEILRFSGVTLPLPKGYEANTARFDESTFSPAGRGARFDTVWARR